MTRAPLPTTSFCCPVGLVTTLILLSMPSLPSNSFAFPTVPLSVSPYWPCFQSLPFCSYIAFHSCFSVLFSTSNSSPFHKTSRGARQTLWDARLQAGPNEVSLSEFAFGSMTKNKGKTNGYKEAHAGGPLCCGVCVIKY